MFVLGSFAFTPLIVTPSGIFFELMLLIIFDPGTPNVLADDFKGEGHSRNRIFFFIANKKFILS